MKTLSNEIEKFFSIRELGELGIGKKTKIYRLIKEGVFTPIKMGASTRIRESEVKAYIKQCQMQSLNQSTN